MAPNPRDYDTPDDYDDAMQDYIAYMETMYDRIDMEIERQKEDERVANLRHIAKREGVSYSTIRDIIKGKNYVS